VRFLIIAPYRNLHEIVDETHVGRKHFRIQLMQLLESELHSLQVKLGARLALALLLPGIGASTALLALWRPHSGCLLGSLAQHRIDARHPARSAYGVFTENPIESAGVDPYLDAKRTLIAPVHAIDVRPDVRYPVWGHLLEAVVSALPVATTSHGGEGSAEWRAELRNCALTTILRKM
jgi:hypothetical protein